MRAHTHTHRETWSTNKNRHIEMIHCTGNSSLRIQIHLGQQEGWKETQLLTGSPSYKDFCFEAYQKLPNLQDSHKLLLPGEVPPCYDIL